MGSCECGGTPTSSRSSTSGTGRPAVSPRCSDRSPRATGNDINDWRLSTSVRHRLHFRTRGGCIYLLQQRLIVRFGGGFRRLQSEVAQTVVILMALANARKRAAGSICDQGRTVLSRERKGSKRAGGQESFWGAFGSIIGRFVLFWAGRVGGTCAADPIGTRGPLILPCSKCQRLAAEWFLAPASTTVQSASEPWESNRVAIHGDAPRRKNRNRQRQVNPLPNPPRKGEGAGIGSLQRLRHAGQLFREADPARPRIVGHWYPE